MATTFRDEAAAVAAGADHPSGGEATSVPATLPSLGKLSTALAKAQGEMKNAATNQTNPHYKNKYADLAAIRDATIPALSKHGLSIDHRFDYRYDTFCVIGELRHESGEMIESLFPLPANATPQVIGSAITYGKRYTWAGLCGVAAEADDDAEAAQANVATRGNSPSVARKAVAAAVGNGGAKIERQPGISKLKEELRAFWRDMEACGDEDEFIGLLGQSAELLDRCSIEAPDIWEGSGDVKGIKTRIGERKVELKVGTILGAG